MRLRPCVAETRLVRAGYCRHDSGASRERARILRRAQDGSVHVQRILPSSSHPARSTLKTRRAYFRVNNRNIQIYIVYQSFDVDEDIKTNSTVFHWPDHIQTIFEVCRNRLMSRREQAEDELKRRVQRFEDKLNEYGREVDSFRKKEVSAWPSPFNKFNGIWLISYSVSKY